MNRFWTLNKLIALGVLGAFAALLLELRFDHRNVLGEHWQSWVPLIYSGTMLIVGAASLYWWKRGGRVLLYWGFALALVVGGVGFWMHIRDEPAERIETMLAAWSQPVAEESGHDENQSHDKGAHAESGEHHDEAEEAGHHDKPALQNPPVLAPLAFAGLGLLGMLACARRFQPKDVPLT